MGEDLMVYPTRRLQFPPLSVCSLKVTARLTYGLCRKHLPSSALVSVSHLLLKNGELVLALIPYKADVCKALQNV